MASGKRRRNRKRKLAKDSSLKGGVGNVNDGRQIYCANAQGYDRSDDWKSALKYPHDSVRGNPHAWQRFDHGPATSSSEQSEQQRFTRVLDLENAKQIEFRPRKGENKTTLHWGQRKIFLSWLEFLTKVVGKANEESNDGPVWFDVVCAGCAPATHLPILHSWFPNCDFHCYDQRLFGNHVKYEPGIFLYRRAFTEQDAKFWNSPEEVPYSLAWRLKKNLKIISGT